MKKFPVDQQLEKIEGFSKTYIQIIMGRIESQKGAFYRHDLYLFYPVADRAVNLNAAIVDCAKTKNIVGGGILLRCLLDTLMCFVFLSFHPKANEYFDLFIEEGRLCKKGKKGNTIPIPDHEIRKFINGEAGTPEIARQINEVYKETSDFVHFSHKHVYGLVQDFSDTEKKAGFKIGIGNSKWEGIELQKYLETVIHINESIMGLLAKHCIK